MITDSFVSEHIHVAIFRWKDDVSNAQVAEALQRLKSLEAVLEGVRIYCGANTSRWSQGFTHAVVVVGETAIAIDAYRNHPLHVEIAETIDAMEADGIGVDFADLAADGA